jgi:hypothetical protein
LDFSKPKPPEEEEDEFNDFSKAETSNIVVEEGEE